MGCTVRRIVYAQQASCDPFRSPCESQTRGNGEIVFASSAQHKTKQHNTRTEACSGRQLKILLRAIPAVWSPPPPPPPRPCAPSRPENRTQERRSCPQCGAKVGAKGSNRIIPLFLQNLVAKDTGELEAARELLEEEKRLRKQVRVCGVVGWRSAAVRYPLLSFFCFLFFYGRRGPLPSV